MAIRVACDRTPVSVHGTKDELESLIRHLRETTGFVNIQSSCLIGKMTKKRLFSSTLRVTLDGYRRLCNGRQNGCSITKIKL